jgi:hypothetical protein
MLICLAALSNLKDANIKEDHLEVVEDMKGFVKENFHKFTEEP